jgi:hypothetical protein
MNIYFIIVAILFGIAFLIEKILIGTGNQWYYEHGFIIYTKYGKLPVQVNLPLSIEYIQSTIPESKYEGFIVTKMADNRFALRERFFRYNKQHYAPDMRGRITLNPEKREMEIKGLLNLTPGPLLIFILSIASLINFKLVVFLGLALFIFTIFNLNSFSIQSKRYNEISEKLIY